jgi:hypothetical protein
VSTDHTSDTSTIASGNVGRFHLGSFHTPPASVPSTGAQTQPESTESALEFRVVRDGTSPRRLKLTGARYTFGNAEGCSIRLSDPALRPMHAVLLHDLTSVTLRGYSEPIEINGAFELESRLNVGDVFRLGQYEFSLIDRQVPKPVSREPSFIGGTPTDSHETNRMVGGPVASIVSDSSALPPVEDSLWRKRLHEEVDQWRQRQKECQVREDELRGRESDLWRRAQELQERDDTIRTREVSLRSRESELKEVQEASSQRQSEIALLRDRANRQSETLRQREDELISRRAQMEQQESLFQSKLDDAARQLMNSQHQADAATASVARLREQFDSLNRQVDELTAQQGELESREQSSIQRQEAILVDLDRYRQRVAEADENQAAAIRERDRAEAARQEADKARKSAEQIVHIKTRDAELAAQRLDELSRQVADLRDQAIAEAARKDVRLRESRDEIDILREQIDELQDTVEQARRESAELRERCETAEAKVRQLETVAAENQEYGRQLADTDQLRSAMDHLSLELARANEELSKVRSDNDSLSFELDSLRRQRDEAIESRAELESKLGQSVPRQQYDSLKIELDSTAGQLRKVSDDSASIRLSSDNPGDAWTDREASSAMSVARDYAPSFSDLSVLQPENSERKKWHSSIANIEQDVSATQNVHQAVDEISASVDRTAMWRNAESNSAAIPESAWDRDAATSSFASTTAPEEFIGQTQSEPIELNQSVWLPTVEHSEPIPVSDASRVWNLAVTPDEDVIEGDNPWPTYQEPTRDEVEAINSHWSNEIPRTPEIPESIEIEERYEEFAQDVGEDLPSPSLWFGSPANDDADASVSHVDDESAPEQSMVIHDEIAEGSIASRLLKEIERADLEMRERESQAQDSSEDGTYLMSRSQSLVDHDKRSEQHEDAIALEDSSTYLHTGSNDYGYSDDSTGQGLDDSQESLNQPQADDHVYLAREYSQPENLQPELPQAQEVEQSTAAVDVPEADSDDDSIEAYMNRLLGRVQGRSGKESTPAASVSMSTVTKGRPTLAATPEPSIATEEVTQNTRIESNTPIVPRSQAPEKNSDLSAMRQLANDSARSAISASVEKRTRQIRMQALIHFMVAGACILLGGVATTIVRPPILYVSWLMAAVATVVSLKQGLTLWNESRKSAKRG